MTKLEQIPYTDRGTALTGWLARPAGTPRAAIAVFPTIMNITPAVEAKALALAEAGYLAFVADFYGHLPQDFAEASAAAEQTRADPVYRDRLFAALAAMAELAPDARQAAIGFCMGGQAVLELARAGADSAMATPILWSRAATCWPSGRKWTRCRPIGTSTAIPACRTASPTQTPHR